MKKNLIILVVMIFSIIGLWGEYSGTGSFEKITNLDGLESGSYYVFYGINGSNTGAMENTISGGRLGNEAISPSSNQISDPSIDIVWKVEEVESGKYTVYNEAAGKYAEIKTSSTKGFSLNATSSHTYTVSYDTKGFFFKSNSSTGGNRGISIFKTDWRPYVVGASERGTLELYKLNIAADPKVATPTFSQEPGTYYESFNVTISCETEEVAIYYTLNGEDPTIESSLYETDITISETTTLKAIAVKDGYTNSEPAEAAYVITIPNPLITNFEADRTLVYVGQSISFTSTSADGYLPYSSYLWSFGDSNTSTDENPTHSYLSTGIYTVSLTVTDGNDVTETETKTSYITVEEAPTGAIDLFFSEYIEGTSNNKAIEIYNGTGVEVDLTLYTVRLASNGNDWNNTCDMTGTLAAGDVYVIGNSGATAGGHILAVSNTTNTVTYFNGDDALGLFYNDVLIDRIGVPNLDPLVKWDVAGITEATDNHTLVRKSSVFSGNTNWAASAGTNAEDSEWIVYDLDDFSYLGSHDFDGVETSVEPTIGTLYMSEISDATNESNEYMELYNNSDDVLSLENVLIKMDGTIDFLLKNYTGDRVVLPHNYLIISRGADLAAFELEFNTLPEGVGFLQGDAGMLFGEGEGHTWQLILDTGSKALITLNDTVDPVGGAGNTSYQASPNNWTTVPAAENTPGAAHGDQTLPVTLASFMAIQTSENFAQLTWVTHSESGLIGYNVLRSETEEVALALRVNKGLIEANNISSSSTYFFTDHETEMNTTYYYWLESNEFNGSTAMFGPINIRISEDNDTPEIVIPTKSGLRSIYPNPFNPSTTVNFYMDKTEMVKINVYNVKGQLINKVATGEFTEGYHNITWNGKDLSGNACASGIYFFKMETRTENQIIKGILMK